MNNFEFQEIYAVVISKWPEILCPKSQSHLVMIEEDISHGMIGMDFELIYREMSYSIMLVLSKTELLAEPITKSSIDGVAVRAMFESRISDWKEENDGFTSDIKGLKMYCTANKHNKLLHPSDDAPAD